MKNKVFVEQNNQSAKSSQGEGITGELSELRIFGQIWPKIGLQEPVQRAFTGVRVQRTLLGPSESLLKDKFAEIFTTFTAKIFVFCHN